MADLADEHRAVLEEALDDPDEAVRRAARELLDELDEDEDGDDDLR